MDRRNLLKFAGSALLNGALVAGGASAFLRPASATPTRASAVAAPSTDARVLSFMNTHTGEQFADAYWLNGNYVPDALAAINQVMRDHRSGEVHAIDASLLDQLYRLRGDVGAAAPFQIISGYRSPATNAALHDQSAGVATRSLHMDGRAIDIRVAGIELPRLRDAALAMQAGGVGFYEASDFIHIDTGRVRRW
jgi:uncharacterized protein YcbK (DUF882 family)